MIKDNEAKVKLNKALPYLVANVVELLDAPLEVRRQTAPCTDATRIFIYSPRCAHCCSHPTLWLCRMTMMMVHPAGRRTSTTRGEGRRA